MVVIRCLECKHCQLSAADYYCIHRKMVTEKNNRIENPYKIPEWCPLPEAQDEEEECI
jgi:hypothetical protein